jgi:hypothetical protein
VRTLLALVTAITAALVAWPILGNYFHADDFSHLLELAAFGPRDFILAPNAGHMYLVRNAAFYVSFLAFDMQPPGYFACAVATHVLNALLLFALARRLTGDALVACLGAVLFAVSPARTGTLGWYSVYGHALATTATLTALLVVAPTPGTSQPISLRHAVIAVLAMLVASQCFGTGAAVAVVFPAVALLLRPATLRTARPTAVLVGLPVLVLIAWAVMNAMPSRLNPWGMEAAKGFVQLATDYRKVVLMTVHLFGVGIQTLVAGPVMALARYGEAGSLVVVALFVAGLAATLGLGSHATRRLLVAFLLATLACYVAVAGGRAALYVAYAHENLVHAIADATRYHYLAQAFLALVLCVVVDDLARRAPRVLPGGVPAAQGLVAAWLVWAVTTGLLLQPPVDHFESERALVARVRDRLDSAIEKVPRGSTLCLPIESAALAFGFPGSAGVFLLLHDENTVDGRRVYFTSSDPKILASRTAGGRMEQLLLPASACPPASPP